MIRSLSTANLIELSRRGRHTVYRLTSVGSREKLRLLRLLLDETVNQYTQIRDEIAKRLEDLGNHKRIVVYGVGDIAQIAYIAVASNGIELVGLVDDRKAGQQFFGHTVADPSELVGGHLAGKPYEIVILASYTRSGEMKENLRRMNIHPSKVFSLFD